MTPHEAMQASFGILRQARREGKTMQEAVKLQNEYLEKAGYPIDRWANELLQRHILHNVKDAHEGK